MSVNGLVTSVQIVPQGSELTAAAGIGDTELLVEDPTDFDDAGGDLEVDGIRYTYVEADEDTSTITLAVPLTAAVTVDSQVFVVAGGQVLVDHVAYVTTGEGDHAEVDIPFAERVLWPEGVYPEPVPVLVSDDLERIVAVPGRAPALNIMDTFRVDSATGQVTIIGEVGTALPDEIGVFLFSTKFSYAGAQAAMPTLQFNTGATVVQPRIEGNTVLAAGLFLSSGRDSGERESKLDLKNNEALLYVQDAPGGAIGSYLWVQNDRISGSVNAGGVAGAFFEVGDDVELRGYPRYGAANLGGHFTTYESGSDAYAFMGMQNSTGSNRQGMLIREGVSTRIYTGGPLEVTTQGGGAWRPVEALSFDVMSDRRSKRDLAAPSSPALDVIRAAPAYEFTYLDDPDDVRRLGVMAGDLPDILTVDLGTGDPDHFAAGMKGVSLPQQVALLWQAIGEIDVELDRAPGLRLKKPARATRRTT